MKFKIICFIGALLISVGSMATVSASSVSKIAKDDSVMIKNPISVQYLKTHLNKSTPKLILTPAIEKQLRKEVRTDPVMQNMYKVIQLNAKKIMRENLLERKKIGKRLLAVSRKMLYRMNILGIIYSIDKDPDVLSRINKEILTVSKFKDWNPSHFLDVAEMSMAVAIALDWTGGDLPKETIKRAKKALIEKGIKSSYKKEGTMGWIKGTNNWNQVCNGGMIAASIAVADKAPELAAKTIRRSLNGIPYALKQYAPDGVYPEGPTYWGYGTSFTALTSSMLKSAFNTDFGLSEYPPLLKSANFLLSSIAPSDRYYNFFDAGDKRSENGNLTLAWFASLTGNNIYFEKQRFLRDPKSMGTLSRHAGAGLIWISQFRNKNENKLDKTNLPLNWGGKGDNPVVFFRGGKKDPRQYYFGGKGGQASHSHGNMDAGSFIFELDGVRWVVDSGTQSYQEIEKTGFDLWGSCQECDRWKLLTKNNFGHSTLTVNNTLYNVNGHAKLINFKNGDQPKATFDLSEVFGNNLKKATRKFVKDSNHSLVIKDQFETTESTKLLTWQLMTTANVESVKNGAILRKEGKQLKLEILSHPAGSVSVISLDPPPFKLDKTIEDLKRIEIRFPAYLFPSGEGSIKVRLFRAENAP